MDPPATRPTLADDVARLRQRVECEAHTLTPLTLQSLSTVLSRLALFCAQRAAARLAEQDRRAPR